MTPPTSPLYSTLAQLIQYHREHRGYSQRKLAETAALSLKQIEDLEAGIELILSPAIRQKLARVLRIRPQLLQQYEKQQDPLVRPSLSEQGRNMLMEEMLHFPDADYPCPACNAPLFVRIFHRKDLEDNPLVEVKAQCNQCLFKL